MNFLNSEHQEGAPLVLGLSGGPDSLYLLHLLLKHREKSPFTLHIAHVNHGWREESHKEAEELSKMAKGLNLPFHLEKLTPSLGNLEEEARKGRYAFFKRLVTETNSQALLLGHHADDQAETILKRLFEGGSLINAGGMSKISFYEGMTVWRPLLGTRKQEILAWLEEEGLSWFEDPTNLSKKFLRGKLRTELLPSLTAQFGKEIVPGLLRLGEEARELSEYFELKVENFNPLKGPFGLFWDFSDVSIEHSIEWKILIRKLLAKEGLVLPSSMVQTIAKFLKEKAANKSFSLKGNTLFIDRGRLFLCVHLLDKWESSFSKGPASNTDWRSLWQGQASVTLPKGDYSLIKPSTSMKYGESTTLDKWWTAHKVPAFLRTLAPVVVSNGVVVHEFLTGKSKQMRRLKIQKDKKDSSGDTLVVLHYPVKTLS